jgi:hypothetical protein
MTDDLRCASSQTPNDLNENGQVLPGVILLLVLLSSIAIGLVQYLDRTAKAIYNTETNTLATAEGRVQSHIALNGIVLNNIKIQRQAQNLLSAIDFSITHGMAISATSLLWENKLPIPQPHDILNVLRDESKSTLQFVWKTAIANKKLIALAEKFATVNINLLTLGQSLCQMPCLQKVKPKISGFECHPSVAPADSCMVAMQPIPGISTPLSSLPLKALFPESVWNAPGFLFLESRGDIENQESTAHAFQSGVVHPAMCISTLIGFHLPCLKSQHTMHTLSNVEHRLSFMPHWSVAFEYTKR